MPPPHRAGGSLLAAPPAGINPLVAMCCQVPQRTSPTGPKNTPNPARLGNVPSGILRKNSPAARNGGTEADAQILELNQQVGVPCQGLWGTAGLGATEGFSQVGGPCRGLGCTVGLGG